MNNPEQDNESAIVRQNSRNVGRLLLGSAAVVVGAGIVVAGVEHVDADQRNQVVAQQEIAQNVKPLMVDLNKQLIADHTQDPSNFVLTPVGETPNGMQAVKISDSYSGMGSVPDSAGVL